MLLSCRFLIDVQGINSFEQTSQVEIAAGDDQTLYIQLIDASLDRPEQGYSPSGRRYMAAAGATLSVTFVNVDDAKQFTRVATKPFAGDTSIWSVPILTSDPVKGTVSLKLTLVQGAQRLNVAFAPGVLLRVR